WHTSCYGDWSPAVCSADLDADAMGRRGKLRWLSVSSRPQPRRPVGDDEQRSAPAISPGARSSPASMSPASMRWADVYVSGLGPRSEERRVGDGGRPGEPPR